MRSFFAVLLFFLMLDIVSAAGIFERPFSNGSPQCTSCHSISSLGIGGKTMGPDLSTLFYDMGQDPETIKSFIKESGIPMMDAVYKNKNIPEEELDQLVRAFEKLPEKAEAASGGNYIFPSIIVFLIILLVLKLFFQRNKPLEENI